MRVAATGDIRTIDAGRVRYRTWDGDDAERSFANVGSVGMSGAVVKWQFTGPQIAVAGDGGDGVLAEVVPFEGFFHQQGQSGGSHLGQLLEGFAPAVDARIR